MSAPSSLHLKAAKQREAGQSAQALGLYEQALVEYLLAGEREFLINIYLEKVIVLRHLHEQTPLEDWLTLIHHQLEQADSFRETATNEQQALLELAWGEYEQLRESYPQAKQHCSQALQLLPPDHIAYGNFRAHLAWSHFLMGDLPAAEDLLRQAQFEIGDRVTDHSSLEYRVWLSGANMKLAQVWHNQGQHQAAQDLLQETATLLNETDTPIRWRQLQELQSQLS